MTNFSRRSFLVASGSIAAATAFGLPARARTTRPATTLRDVNATDITSAITLACRTMSNVFNPADDKGAPFFASSVRPRPWLGFNPDHTEAHVPGRHLNALLHAEAAAGQTVDEAAVEQHARAAFYSYSGAVPLPLNRDRIGGRLVRFLPHNLREGFHALYALARYRNSARAREIAERSITAIGEFWDPERGWNRDRLERQLGLTVIEWPGGSFITGIARAIGPLVKYYAATGHAPALRLAVVLKEKALADFFRDDGAYDAGRFPTHTHSITCVMSSLAELAELTNDGPLLGRVQRFFDNGLTRLSDQVGWSIENAGPNANPDRGECNNTGDLLETALILGRAGYTEYYDRAELVLRAHLLPAQLRDVSFIPADVLPDGGGASVAARHLGAFGFPAPYGHQPVGVDDVSFNMDIVGGATDALVAAYAHVVTTGRAGTKVNLWFDHETPAAKVESPYTSASGAALRVTPKVDAPLHVRLPGWLDLSRVAIDGGTPPVRSGGWLVFTGCPVGKPVTLRFTLPSRELTLKHRTRAIRVRLRGDAVVAMDNFGANLTFFDSMD